MIYRTIRHLCLFAALCAVFCARTAAAAAPAAAAAAGPGTLGAAALNTPGDAAQAQARLQAIRARIAELTRRLASQLGQRDALSARLRDSDLEVTAKRRALEAVRAAQLAALHRRSELAADEARGQSALDSERGALAAQVRMTYLIGRQEQLRLLLTLQSPSSAGRMLDYDAYLARARAAKIDVINADVRRVRGLLEEIDQTNAHLTELENDASREVADLENARRERARTLAALSARVTSADQELQQLEREERTVETLVAELSRMLQDFPLNSREDFHELRGKLAWPVPGRLAVSNQDSRAAAVRSGAHGNGILIESSRGAKVRAPCFGRVVYADWLQGLGLLLIVAHNGGYMTLYGHAEVLYKTVGDEVAPGDVIAALSDAPGAPPHLYFEIREGRKSMDARAWLKANP